MHVTPLPPWITERPFAHRGLHDTAAGIPENTMAAFDAAVASGYAIELDVRQMRDGVVVVFHDKDLRRACGLDRNLAELGWGEVQPLGLFGSKHGIPRLAEVLTRIAGRVPLLIEVKEDSGHPGIERALHEMLSQYNGPFALQSFSPRIVRWFRKSPIDAPLGLVAGPIGDARVGLWKKLSSRSLLGVLVSRPHFINYDLRATPNPWLDRVSRLGSLPVICWTVKTERDKQKAEAQGFNYVFENVRP